VNSPLQRLVMNSNEGEGGSRSCGPGALSSFSCFLKFHAEDIMIVGHPLDGLQTVYVANPEKLDGESEHDNVQRSISQWRDCFCHFPRSVFQAVPYQGALIKTRGMSFIFPSIVCTPNAATMWKGREASWVLQNYVRSGFPAEWK
jgi:hypothetical protein